MTLFYILYVRRSDGRLETASSKGQKERNEPTGEQLDQTPNAQGVSDYYRPLGEEEPKYIDWRRKLGGMLAREIGGSDYQPDRAYILHALPHNYRLYEHIKSKSGDGSEPKAKNHAGGGHDRQDAYLYGHPSGRKKRFRSPADFFPHLLWLATDSKGDPMNCSCKICTPDDLQPDVPKETKAAASPLKKEAPSNSIPPPSKQMTVEVQIPTKRPSSSNGPKQATPTLSAAPTGPLMPAAASAQAAPAAPLPTPLPQPRNADQQLDTYYNRLVYRAGEVVWFNKGQAWGLGVITRRWWVGENGQRETRGYLIQPLSHPLHHPPQVQLGDEKALRPWLAWSAPNYTNEMLNNIKVTYDAADWDGILAKRYGQGDAEVDGSILAARAVDARYSLGELLRKRQLNQSVEIRFYNSIFIGGEKIWTGEPIRIGRSGGTDIMIVNTIEARVQIAGGANTIASITFGGDKYQYMTVPHNPQMNLPSDKSLPLRVREDLRYRNSVSVPVRRQVSFWKLSASLARVDMAEVRGRWYESSLLLPLLIDLEEMIKAGNIEDCNAWTNSRGAASEGQNIFTNRSASREEAFGQAVPPDFRIVEGHQQPFPDEIAAATASVGGFHQQQQQQQQQSHDQLMQDAGPFDQMIDLGAMEEEGMPGYVAQEFGSQEHFF